MIPKSLLPAGERSEIRERAERYYLQGMEVLLDIHVVPTNFSGGFLFGCHVFAVLRIWRAGGGEDCKAVDRSGILPYISRQRILYGCVRDGFREILDTPNDRIHKIKRLIQALNETRQQGSTGSPLP
ncbi:MAG: hypothetical protein ACLSFA_14220 [Roseburia inulinivorans]